MLRVDTNLALVYLECATLSAGYIGAIYSGQVPKESMEIKRSRAYNLLRSDDRLSLAHAVRGILVDLIL